jgi:hypothetical protein
MGHRRRELLVTAALVVAAAACSSDGSKPAPTFAAVLCPTVQAWSDQSVGVVNTFSDRSVDASGPAQRRQYYQDAFAGLEQQLDDLSARVDRLPAAPVEADTVKASLRDAIADMRAGQKEAASASAALPDASYEVASVTEGRLFTGLEKSQAIVYQTLTDLSEKYGEQVVPKGCGRRGAVDLSPSVTPPKGG